MDNYKLSNAAKEFAVTLVEETLERNASKEVAELIEKFSPLAACKELCTVSVRLPRRCGNSTIANELGRRGWLNTITIVPNISSKISIKYGKFVETWDTYKERAGCSINVVIIDISSMISKQKLDDIYNTFGPSKVYLLVG